MPGDDCEIARRSEWFLPFSDKYLVPVNSGDVQITFYICHTCHFARGACPAMQIGVRLAKDGAVLLSRFPCQWVGEGDWYSTFGYICHGDCAYGGCGAIGDVTADLAAAVLALHSIPGQKVGGEIVRARNVGHAHLEAAECRQDGGNPAARREFSFGQLLVGLNARFTVRQERAVD